MASAIDPTKPTAGNATTASVRANFSAAKTEIELLQTDTATHYANQNNPHALASDIIPDTTERVPSNYVPGYTNSTALTVTAIVAGKIYLAPFKVPYKCQLANASIDVTTGAAGNVQLALYGVTSIAKSFPKALLNSSASISTAGTGHKVWSPSTQLASNTIYWIAANFSAAPTIRTLPVAAIYPYLGVDVAAADVPIPQLMYVRAFGAWDADLSALAIANSAAPFPMFRLQFTGN